MMVCPYTYTTLYYIVMRAIGGVGFALVVHM